MASEYVGYWGITHDGRVVPVAVFWGINKVWAASEAEARAKLAALGKLTRPHHLASKGCL